jgi:hypothetical protein
MTGTQETIDMDTTSQVPQPMKRRLFFTRVAAMIAGGSVIGWVLPGLARKARAASQAPASATISARVHPLAVPRTKRGATSHG